MNNNSANEADRLVLVNEAKSLAKAIEEEKQNMLDCQFQREKLNFFWVVDKNALEQKKSELRNKDRLKEDRKERQDAELLFLKDRVKQVLLEQNSDVVANLANTSAELGFLHDEHQAYEDELRQDQRELLVHMKCIEREHRAWMLSLSFEHSRKVEAVRAEFHRRTQEVETIFESKVEEVRAAHDKKLTAKSLEIGNAMAAHVNDLLSQHRKELEGVQLYFESITLSNLDRIKNLKKSIEELQANNTSARVCRLKHHNQRMQAPIQSLVADKERLKREVEKYAKETQKYEEVQCQLRNVGETYDRSSFEFEVLTQRLGFLRQEAKRDRQRNLELSSKISQRSGFHALLLNEKQLER